MSDDYSPVAVGDTGTPLSVTFQHLADGTPVNLTGATISMKMLGISAANSGVVQTCTGVWTVASDATTGKASYAFVAGDVAVAGVWQLYITITISGKPVHGDVKTLVIGTAP